MPDDGRGRIDPADRRELADGYYVSPVLKGGWQLAESHGEAVSDTPIEDTFAFLDAGITTFDCADIYTGVEELIGRFRERHRERRGVYPAAQVHTKFVPDRSDLADVDRAYVERIVDRSRRRLNVSSLDLVQFHWWEYGVDGYVAAAGHLADLQREGKVDRVGVTNFDVARLRELLDAGVPVASNQVQYSLLDDRPARGMAEFGAEHGVGLLCYGTLAGGFLTGRYLGAPEPEPPFENRSLTKYKLVIDDAGGWEPFQDLLSALDEVAARRDASVASVATRWVLDRPGVVAAIVGARDTGHLADTVATVDLELDERDRERIAAARAELDQVPGDVYELERTDQRHASIMKYDLNEGQDAGEE